MRAHGYEGKNTAFGVIHAYTEFFSLKYSVNFPWMSFATFCVQVTYDNTPYSRTVEPRTQPSRAITCVLRV